MKLAALHLLVLAGLIISVVTPSEARRRGPRKPVEHFTYDPAFLEDKLSRYRGVFDRAVLLNHEEGKKA